MTRPCKFTPLGFETGIIVYNQYAVSLCKFTPLGFETLEISEIVNDFVV